MFANHLSDVLRLCDRVLGALVVQVGKLLKGRRGQRELGTRVGVLFLARNAEYAFVVQVVVKGRQQGMASFSFV